MKTVDPKRLFGLSSELDTLIRDIALLTERHHSVHPASSSNISQVMSEASAAQLRDYFGSQASKWFEIGKLHDFVKLRHDGRDSYTTENVADQTYLLTLRSLAGKVMLITTTSSDLSTIQKTIDQNQEGKLFNLIEVDQSGCRIRLLYGNKQYGTIPSSEIGTHLMANAMSLRDGLACPGTLHAHCYYVVMLARERLIAGDYHRFNASLYAQNESMRSSHPHLVGVVPYEPSASAGLILTSQQALERNRIIVWMNHGIVIRSESVKKAYSRLALIEHTAREALDMIRFGAVGLPESEIRPFLREHNLVSAYRQLFGTSEPIDYSLVTRNFLRLPTEASP